MNIQDGYINDIKNSTISEIFIKQLVKNYLNENGLDEYLDDIKVFTSNKGLYSYYDPFSETILLNSRAIIENYMDKNKNRIRILGSNRIYEEAYLVLLQTLYHELTHVKQEAIKESRKDSLEKELIVESELIMNNDNKFYHKNHDIFPAEHLADYEGAKEVLNFNFFVQNQQINISLLMKQFLLSGYKKKYKLINSKPVLAVESPTELFYCSFKVEPPQNNDSSLDSRIHYGYPITVEEYDKYLTGGKQR